MRAEEEAVAAEGTHRDATAKAGFVAAPRVLSSEKVFTGGEVVEKQHQNDLDSGGQAVRIVPGLVEGLGPDLHAENVPAGPARLVHERFVRIPRVIEERGLPLRIAAENLPQTGEGQTGIVLRYGEGQDTANGADVRFGRFREGIFKPARDAGLFQQPRCLGG